MKKTFLLLIIISLISCGQVTYDTAQNDTVENTDESISVEEPNLIRMFAFATDYVSSGQLYTATYDNTSTTLENTGLTLLGTEARVKLYASLLYILHAGGAFNSISTDNLQIVNPYDDDEPFITLAQYSTGNGTNPQDVVISGKRAFISLYNPANDSENVTNEGLPGDVIEMDTTDGSIVHRHSFQNYLQADGDLNANAARMAIYGNVLYVCLQDLESNTFSATAPGLIGMINILDNEVIGVITLQSRNPYDMALSIDEKRLYITSTYNYFYDGTFGGLEIIDLETQTSELFIPDSEFGGYIERVVTADDQAFAVVSLFDMMTFTFQSKLINFPTAIEAGSESADFEDFGTDIRDIFYQDDHLWVSYRVISTEEGDSDPMIKLFDLTTNTQVGDTLYPVVTAISIAGN